MRILRTLLLPFAILMGLLVPEAHQFAWMIRWLLALMVFLSFVGPSKASWKSAYRVLWRLLPLWFALGPALALLSGIIFHHHPDISWIFLLVAMAPTATAAPAVVRMRGGDPSIVVSGVVLQHILVGLLLPLWVAVFSALLWSSPLGISPWTIPVKIMTGTLPLILVPLLLGKGFRHFVPKVADQLVSFRPLSLFLWAVAVFLVVSRARADFAGMDIMHGPGAYVKMAVIALISLILCVVQFALGRRLSTWSHKEEGAQILGQKNTILMIWIAGTWFGPWVSLGPLFYVLWQNLYIAWLARKS